MPVFVLHPTARIALWLLLLLAIQCLEGWLLAAAFAGLPLLGRAALRRGARLVWRSRWLILSLFVVFAWGVAGEPLAAGRAMPTHEGLHEAWLHMGRLLLVLLAVAAFLESIPLPELLAGSRQLLSPLRRLGLDSDRAVVRLMLVLHYVETLPRPRDWRILLDPPAPAAGQIAGFAEFAEFVEVDSRPLRGNDYLAVSAGILAFMACCLS